MELEKICKVISNTGTKDHKRIFEISKPMTQEEADQFLKTCLEAGYEAHIVKNKD